MSLDAPKHLSKDELVLWKELCKYKEKVEELPEYYDLFFSFLGEKSGSMSRECYGDCIVYECPYTYKDASDSEKYGLEVVKKVLKVLDEGGALID